jgi:hypothetical protein
MSDMDHRRERASPAKTASLTSDMIEVRKSRRRFIDVPAAAAAGNKPDAIHESVDKILAEELSIGAIAMLWSKESGHAASEIETELFAAFQERLKGCSMEMSKDATISRQELLRFCDDARIDPPKFWGRVA